MIGQKKIPGNGTKPPTDTAKNEKKSFSFCYFILWRFFSTKFRANLCVRFSFCHEDLLFEWNYVWGDGGGGWFVLRECCVQPFLFREIFSLFERVTSGFVQGHVSGKDEIVDSNISPLWHSAALRWLLIAQRLSSSLCARFVQFFRHFLNFFVSSRGLVMDFDFYNKRKATLNWTSSVNCSAIIQHHLVETWTNG